MRILYQPTESTPSDWRQVDSAQWADLNSFTCHALCVQGISFDGADHYAVQPVSSGVVKVVIWNDDPDDWPAGQRWAREWTFRHLERDSDPKYGGAIRPRHSQVIYAESGIRAVLEAAYGGNPDIVFKDWTEFNPNLPNPMDGSWVTDAQHADQQSAQSVQGWRTWTEGLDPSELDENGLVKCQRVLGRYQVPQGTRTYYHNTTDASTPHNADHENLLGTSPGGVGSETSGGVGTGGYEIFSTITSAGEPASGSWPTTGLYRYQIDCTAVGADLTFGLLTQGGAGGHFSRINAAGDTDQQTIAQDQSAFSGSGLHLASITDPAWTSGSSSDRFGFLLSSVRIIGHGLQYVTLQLGESDDFADGPWPEGIPSNSVFFGTHF